MTQRVLEKKIVKKIKKKSLKDKKGKKASLGELSMILSILGLIGIFLISNEIIILLGVLSGIAGFFVGIRGLEREEKKTMSLIGTVLGAVAFLVVAFIIVKLARLRIF